MRRLSDDRDAVLKEPRYGGPRAEAVRREMADWAKGGPDGMTWAGTGTRYKVLLEQ